MSTFNLAEEVGQLDWNFEPYAGRGVIPEPTSEQITAFRQALGELFTAAREGAPETENPDAKTLAEYLARDTTEIDEKLLHTAAAVCSDSPSFDDLSALPYRGRQAFISWVTEKLLVPEQARPVTST